mgnify:CR=1 FL=1
MQFESRLLPFQHGQLYETTLYSSYNHGIPIFIPNELTRLHQEKTILSKGLADCVTYLKVLREKQAKNARQLNIEPPPQPKKRRRLQQTKRHLDSEIKNRERDEQAFLNNLQACETNIFLANMKAYRLADASFHALESTSTPILYTPTLCSHSGSETTDLIWGGWTDEAVASPFQKKGSSPFFVDELAPDTCTEDLTRDFAVAKDNERPPPLFRDAVELSSSLPVPPNTAQSQFKRSLILSPTAAVFKPTYSSVVQENDCAKSKLKRPSMSSSTAANVIDLLQKRRFSAREIAPILQRFERLFPQHPPGQTWCKTTPRPSPQKDAEVQMSRQRTKSL